MSAGGWSGWPVGLTAGLVRHEPGAWSAGARAEFSYRDLGLERASAGAIGARHVRRLGSGLAGFDWHCHESDLQFNYVIAGSAVVENECGERYRLGPGDAICEPALHRVRELEFSPEYECIQITVPAKAGPPIRGRHAPLPERARELDPARSSVYVPAEQAIGVTDRAALRRDLGAAVVAGGRLGIDLVAAVGRYRTAASWLVVLAGSAAAGAERVRLGMFDALCFGDGDEDGLREIAPEAPFRALELSLSAREARQRD